MKVLVLDNYDSFVYNLVHYIKQLGYKDVDVFRNDKITVEEAGKYDKILLSPGPGIPEESGVLLDIIKAYSGKISMMGVCLGHQAIAESFDSELENMNTVLHGIAHKMTVLAEDKIYEGLPKEFNVGRYHSWQIKKETISPDFIITAEDENGNILSVRHKEFDLVGVQFHPESILTEHGLKIVENWLKS